MQAWTCARSPRHYSGVLCACARLPCMQRAGLLCVSQDSRREGAPAALGARSSAPMRRMPRRRRRRGLPGGARARMRCHHEHSIQVRKILGRLFAKYKLFWPPNPAITGSRHGRPWCKPRPGPGAALLAGAAARVRPTTHPGSERAPWTRRAAGPALCLLPLALARRSLSPAAALACLTGAVASASLCYAGFHPYVLARALPHCVVQSRL